MLYCLVKLRLVFVDALSFCGSMQSLVASAPNSGCHFPQEVDCEWFCQGVETFVVNFKADLLVYPSLEKLIGPSST